MPPDERPRQRLLRSGGDSLSDAEVLAVVLGNGCREVCTLELAREILEEAGGLHGLVGVRADSLQRRGLGEAKAASILANLEIARRLAETDLPDRVSLSRPHALAHYLHLNYAVPDQEVVGALYLNGRHRLIGEEEFFRGTLCRATVEPRQILRTALARSAAGVCLFHTHPSVAPRGAQRECHQPMTSSGADEWLGRRARGPEVDPRPKPFRQLGRGVPYHPEG